MDQSSNLDQQNSNVSSSNQPSSSNTIQNTTSLNSLPVCTDQSDCGLMSPPVADSVSTRPQIAGSVTPECPNPNDPTNPLRPNPGDEFCPGVDQFKPSCKSGYEYIQSSAKCQKSAETETKDPLVAIDRYEKAKTMAENQYKNENLKSNSSNTTFSDSSNLTISGDMIGRFTNKRECNVIPDIAYLIIIFWLVNKLLIIKNNRSYNIKLSILSFLVVLLYFLYNKLKLKYFKWCH